MSHSSNHSLVNPTQSSSLPSSSVTLVRWLTRRRIAISLTGFSILVTTNLLVVGAVPCNPLKVLQPQVAIGLMAVMAGLLIRSWSAGTLNKSREITASGPYAIVRNPLYIGSFLMMLGFCVLCHDWATLLFVAGPVSWLYWLQVRVEEERLGKMFPGQWPAYRDRVPRFFPRHLSRLAFGGWSASMWWMNREHRALATSLLGLLGIYLWHWVAQA